MLRKNITNKEATISRSVEQRNRKRDEKNRQKHQKQATLIRKQKKNHFYVVKQRNKHISNNIKNNGSQKP